MIATSRTWRGIRQGSRWWTRASAVLAAASLGIGVAEASAQSLVLERRIELPSVTGRIDHMTVDEQGGRLFVAALGADSVEVLDLRAGRPIGRITSLHEPQGVLYMDRTRRLVVANGSGGGVQSFDDLAGPAVARQSTLDDADNLRMDPSSGHIYVGFGKALAELDPDTLKVLRRIELAGHPESFQIEQSGGKIYVNVPEAGYVAVVDHDSSRVVATWRLDGASRNFAMALDERRHRLFVATRLPAQLIVFDVDSGKQSGSINVCGDADDLFIDQARQLIYVVCGEGRIDVVRSTDDEYVVAERVPTVAGARTGLFVPSLSTLLVAVPARMGPTAEVRVYGSRLPKSLCRVSCRSACCASGRPRAEPARADFIPSARAPLLPLLPGSPLSPSRARRY